jgi:hypothetical protein
MRTRGYTILGWFVWKIGSRVAMRKLAREATVPGKRPVSGDAL